VKFLRQLGLLTAKPILYAANVNEDDLAAGAGKWLDQLRAAVQAHHEQAEIVLFSAKFEAELGELSGHERTEYLASAGVSEPGLDRLIHAGYRLLGLQTFFTVGENEVRAWTMHRGGTAFDAAGEIHSDFQRGFIRAETVSFTTSRGWARTRRRGSRGWYEARGGTTSCRMGTSCCFASTSSAGSTPPRRRRYFGSWTGTPWAIQSLLVHLHPAKSSTRIWFREAPGSLSPSRYSDMTHWRAPSDPTGRQLPHGTPLERRTRPAGRPASARRAGRGPPACRSAPRSTSCARKTHEAALGAEGLRLHDDGRQLSGDDIEQHSELQRLSALQVHLMLVRQAVAVEDADHLPPFR